MLVHSLQLHLLDVNLPGARRGVGLVLPVSPLFRTETVRN